MIQLLVISLILSCGIEDSKPPTATPTLEKEYPEECSKFYPFDGGLIDLETLERIVTDGDLATDFKSCSKYNGRFYNQAGDSISIGNRTFKLNMQRKKRLYELEVYNGDELLKSVSLPVNDPLAEVQEYSAFMIPYKKSFFVIMSDFYDVFYRVVEYDLNGNGIQKQDIEKTYVTHPEPNSNHHHPYLYYSTYTNSEIVFTSHMAFADTMKTVMLNMETFETRTYDRGATGYVLDDDDAEVIGFVSTEQDYEKNLTYCHLGMLNGVDYNFELEGTMPACNFLLADSLLYVANYHPIATGSDLHCFDLRTGKRKWHGDVLQIQTGHSEYWNSVTLTKYKGKIVMEGNEAHGSYVQVFDAKSGKRLANFGATEFQPKE